MRSIHFRWIEAFRAVARTGSTTEAAEVLRIDQSAVSRHIKALEGQLGLVLFERRQRGLRLTAEGNELLGAADGAIDGLYRFQASASELAKLTGGHLHVLTSATLARGLFPAVVREFRRQHSDVTIEMEIVARSDLDRKVEMQQFDIAAVAMPFSYPNEHTVELGHYPCVCVLPKGHSLAKRETIQLGDLVDEALVGLPAGTVGRARIDELFRTASLAYQPILETTAVALGEHVAAGVGIAIMDPFSASITFGNLTTVRALSPALEYKFGLLFPSDRPRSALVGTFAEAVLHRASEVR